MKALGKGIEAVMKQERPAPESIIQHKPLKAYMASSRYMGSEEGAVLVFATNAREAKKVAWQNSTLVDICDDQYTDISIKLIDHQEYHLGLTKKATPHAIDNPPTCLTCEVWGYPLGEDHLCENCREDAE